MLAPLMSAHNDSIQRDSALYQRIKALHEQRENLDRATLLALDRMTTLFHEFGHALHGLLATVTSFGEQDAAIQPLLTRRGLSI